MSNSVIASYSENKCFARPNNSIMKERLLDLKYRFIGIYRGIIFSKSIIKLPFRLLAPLQYFPIMFPSASTLSKHDLKKVTVETIERDQIFSSNNVLPNSSIPSKDRLKYLLHRVDYFAKRMGIQKSIDVYTSSKQIATGCAGGTYSRRSPYIQFDLKMITMADDQLDAVIVHELTHAAENHSLQHWIFNMVILSVDIVAGVALFPLAILGTEVAGSVMSQFYSRYSERRSDLGAMRLLGTGKGIREFFEMVVRRNIAIKNAKDLNEFTSKLDPRRVAHLQSKKKLTLEFMKKMQERITPEGNNRSDFAHPSITDRIEYAKQFDAARLRGNLAFS